ncbi:MAG: restriction endonuclease subunit S, partial [Oenococcus oeni]
EYPELRFQGFSGAWEKRKLSDISEKVTQKNTNNSFSEVFTNSAERGIISQLDFFDKDIANQKNISGYFIVKNDDFVYNPRISNLAPVGPIKRNKLGRNGVMSPLYYIFRTHSISPSFLEYYFEGTQWHYFMYLNGDTGARADRFAIKDSVFSTMPIFITSSSEQIQIGSFFKSLDDLITVNQRKLNALKKLKRAYLQKMFPKNGVSIPELRFAGFTTAWEKRKLGDIATFNPVSKIPNRFEYVDLESVVGTEMVFHRTELKENAPSRAQRLAVRGDLFFQTVRPYQKNNYLFDLPDKNYVFSTGYAQIRPMYSGYFLLAMVQRTEVVNKVLERCTGTSYPAISSKDLSELQILIPPSDEQIKIGSFFKSLDELITVNQRKLDKLKELKKGYLQKMFI